MWLLAKLDKSISAALNIGIIISNIAVAALVLFLILSRFFFGASVLGVLELATIFAIWLYMLGAMSASRNKEHLTIDFIEKTIKNKKFLLVHDLLRTILVFAISLFSVYLANNMLQWSLLRPQTTPALAISLMWQQLPMIIMTVFCVVYGLRDIYLAAKRVLVFSSEGGV